MNFSQSQHQPNNSGQASAGGESGLLTGRNIIDKQSQGSLLRKNSPDNTTKTADKMASLMQQQQRSPTLRRGTSRMESVALNDITARITVFEETLIDFEKRHETLKKMLEEKVTKEEVRKLTHDKVTKEELE